MNIVKVGCRMPMSQEQYDELVWWDRFEARLWARQARVLARAWTDLDRRVRHEAHCPPPCPDMADYQRRCRARRRRGRR